MDLGLVCSVSSMGVLRLVAKILMNFYIPKKLSLILSIDHAIGVLRNYNSLTLGFTLLVSYILGKKENYKRNEGPHIQNSS